MEIIHESLLYYHKTTGYISCILNIKKPQKIFKKFKNIICRKIAKKIELKLS